MIHAIDTTGYSKSSEWCVPTSISAITGIPLKSATERLASLRDEPYSELDGCWMEEAILVLHEAGFKCAPINIQERYPHLTHGPKLTTFVNGLSAIERSTVTLVEVSGHALVTHFGFIVDTGHKKPAPVEACWKANTLVKNAWLIRRT